jgi:hypothetical protein
MAPYIKASLGQAVVLLSSKYETQQQLTIQKLSNIENKLSNLQVNVCSPN